jgi:hypothetical protein
VNKLKGVFVFNIVPKSLAAGLNVLRCVLYHQSAHAHYMFSSSLDPSKYTFPPLYTTLGRDDCWTLYIWTGGILNAQYLLL